MEKSNTNDLPIIGVLLFEGVLANEIVAPIDVFSKAIKDGKPLFKVLLISEDYGVHTSEENLKIFPDVNFEDCPNLDALVVPSSMHPEQQQKNQKLIGFIQKQNVHTTYTASHCAGAFLLGEAGIAEGKEVVTYPGGKDQLLKEYPGVFAMDDETITVVQDGKLITSNGNLTSYLASLDLLELFAGRQQRLKIEEELLIHKLYQHEY